MMFGRSRLGTRHQGPLDDVFYSNALVDRSTVVDFIAGMLAIRGSGNARQRRAARRAKKQERYVMSMSSSPLVQTEAVLSDAVSGRGRKPTPSSNKLRVVLVHPQGAVLPEDIKVKHIKAQNFLERLSLGASDTVSLMELSAREAEMISQYSDVFGIDFMVLTGLPNAQYDTVWNMYTQSLERISLDTLPAFLQGLHDIAVAGAPSGSLSDDQLGELG